MLIFVCMYTVFDHINKQTNNSIDQSIDRSLSSLNIYTNKNHHHHHLFSPIDSVSILIIIIIKNGNIQEQRKKMYDMIDLANQADDDEN